MTENNTKKLATQKYLEITKLREHESTLGLSKFQRGQLAGAQQALAWIGKDYVEPIRTILTDEQLAALAHLRKESQS